MIPVPEKELKTKATTVTVAVIIAAALIGVIGGIMILLGGFLQTNKKTPSVDGQPETTITETSSTTVQNGIWISSAELLSLPITGQANCLTGSACGVAWNNLVARANATWGAPDLACQTSVTGADALAGALVYARTGNTALRSKSANAIIAAQESLNSTAEYNDPNLHCGYRPRTLSLGRQLAGYIIAADLINLKQYDPAADTAFRSWLIEIRDVELEGSNSTYGKSLRKTYENWAHNWSAFAGASMIAISRYLGGEEEDAYLARADAIFRSYGVRGVYPTDTWNGGTYFDQTSSSTLDEWKCSIPTWTAISPVCTKGPDADGDTGNIEGAFIEDVNRGIESDALCTTAGQIGFFWNGGTESAGFNCGMQYSWSSIQGLFTQAEMLKQAGYDAYRYNNQQMKRLLEFMNRIGWHMRYGQSQNVPWIANYRYRTNYPTSSPPTLAPSYSIGWTNWTHGAHRPAPSSGGGGGTKRFETEENQVPDPLETQ